MLFNWLRCGLSARNSIWLCRSPLFVCHCSVYCYHFVYWSSILFTLYTECPDYHMIYNIHVSFATATLLFYYRNNWKYTHKPFSPLYVSVLWSRVLWWKPLIWLMRSGATICTLLKMCQTRWEDECLKVKMKSSEIWHNLLLLHVVVIFV